MFLSAFSGSRIPSPSIVSLIRAAVGLPCPPEAYMTLRERFDLTILIAVFSSLLAASVTQLNPRIRYFLIPITQHQHVLHPQFAMVGTYPERQFVPRSKLIIHLETLRLFG